MATCGVLKPSGKKFRPRGVMPNRILATNHCNLGLPALSGKLL